MPFLLSRHDLSCAAFVTVLGIAGAIAPCAAAEIPSAATEQYRDYLIQDISGALASARRLKERIDAKDLEGAKRAWIDARIGWEQAEVFTSGFVSDLDEQIDAWPNALTGFHAIEARLFGAHTTQIG